MSDTETKTITVQGVLVNVSQPYSEGSTINAAEAKALNQMRAENIANNCRKAVKELVDGGGDASTIQAQAQELISARDADYVFTLAATTGGGAKLDPLARECKSIARGLVAEALRNKGMTQKAYLEANGENAINDKVAELMENEAVIAAAKKALKDRAKTVEAAGVSI